MTDIATMYNVTPRNMRRLAEKAITKGVVPFIKGSPGLGKSTIVHSIADKYNLVVIDHRLSTSSPEDLSGLPRFDDNGFARFAPFADLFPIEGTPIPEGKDGWLLFLDEFNHGSKEVQAASYKLILDHMVGQHRLHPRCAIVLAGNLITDRAFVQNISTAMQSRVVHLTMVEDYKEWLEDVAFPQNYDQRIIAYISAYPSKLMDFRPDHNDSTFCCPRTWEFMNKLIKGEEVTEADGALYAGTITSGVAADFVGFTKVYADMVKWTDVVANPTGTPVPAQKMTAFATALMLTGHLTEDTFPKFCQYIERFPLDMQVLFYRSIMAQHPQYRSQPAFATAMVNLSRYLKG